MKWIKYTCKNNIERNWIRFLNQIDLKKEVYINNQTFDKEYLRQLKISLRLNKNIEKLCFNQNKLGENT